MITMILDNHLQGYLVKEAIKEKVANYSKADPKYYSTEIKLLKAAIPKI